MLNYHFRAAMLSIAALMFSCLTPPARAEEAPLTVFAAASLKEALEAVNIAWEKQGKPPARLVLAASGVLARQIEQGAPADLFISADERWMGYLGERRAIRVETRIIIARNSLVLVARAQSARLITLEPGVSAMALTIGGKLVIGDPATVPAGAYAKAALETLGLWEGVQPALVPVENVRVGLALIARGEAETGIVYASDAAIEPRVRIIGRFPPGLHPPVLYPAALTGQARHEDAAAYLAFLQGPEAGAIFRRLGFQ